MSSFAARSGKARAFRLDITPDQYENGSLSETDLAYYAGLFDGEGAVGISRSQPRGQMYPRHVLYASVHMADVEVLNELRALWGGWLGRGMRGEGRRPTMIWRVEARAALPFLEAIAPYLRIKRVRMKVQLGIAFQKQKVTAGEGRSVADDYRDRQRAYFDAMRQLNLRGVESLSSDERASVLARVPVPWASTPGDQP